MFVVPDGSLHHVRVKGSRLLSSRSSAGSSAVGELFEVVEGVVTALALGGPWAVSGSAEGQVCICHTAQSTARFTVATHRGLVRSLSLHATPAPATASTSLQDLSSAACLIWKLLVLFADGELVLWTLPRRVP